MNMDCSKTIRPAHGGADTRPPPSGAANGEDTHMGGVDEVFNTDAEIKQKKAQQIHNEKTDLPAAAQPDRPNDRDTDAPGTAGPGTNNAHGTSNHCPYTHGRRL